MKILDKGKEIIMLGSLICEGVGPICLETKSIALKKIKKKQR